MSTKQSDISQLIEIMAALCNPVDGSARDLKQDVSTIRPYTNEEAYEVRSTAVRFILTPGTRRGEIELRWMGN
ncbi:hypothetical protein EDC40_12112 [Aminobacter aminovorans]|uniref:Nucleoside triphosphate pyrophosphohydrolase n=1 Tax=Aminobacter aminovorans TaxID=83263 RepID=A0A380WJH3_AMIAI|nr:hypothetical protein EDC40_12112 [Aminobacter aminovorans]SUU88406.1 nucleoside triphosphate pyrophosphohydrolase [Aminobacter aminovorans]